MIARTLIGAAAMAAWMGGAEAQAQTAPRGQAASPGEARAMNRLPQPPSGGVATGRPAAGPLSDIQRRADERAKRSTTICKGC